MSNNSILKILNFIIMYYTSQPPLFHKTGSILAPENFKESLI